MVDVIDGASEGTLGETIIIGDGERLLKARRAAFIRREINLASVASQRG